MRSRTANKSKRVGNLGLGMEKNKKKFLQGEYGQFVAGCITSGIWYIYLGVKEPQLMTELSYGIHGPHHWLTVSSPLAIGFLIALTANLWYGSIRRNHTWKSDEIVAAFLSAFFGNISYFVAIIVVGAFRTLL